MRNLITILLIFISCLAYSQNVDPETFGAINTSASASGKYVYTNTGGEGKMMVDSLGSWFAPILPMNGLRRFENDSIGLGGFLSRHTVISGNQKTFNFDLLGETSIRKTAGGAFGSQQLLFADSIVFNGGAVLPFPESISNGTRLMSTFTDGAEAGILSGIYDTPLPFDIHSTVIGVFPDNLGTKNTALTYYMDRLLQYSPTINTVLKDASGLNELRSAMTSSTFNVTNIGTQAGSFSMALSKGAFSVNVDNGTEQASLLLSAVQGFVMQNWTTANRPPSPQSGSVGFNSTLSQMEYWNGLIWVQF